MTRALAMVLALATPAHAAGNAPGAHLWPDRNWTASVIEVTCQALRDCCGIHRACGGYATGPLSNTTTPVPLPPAGLLLTALVAAMIWRMK